METKLTILKPFFEDPSRAFLIREISKLTKINHVTVRKYLKAFVKEGLLSLDKRGLYPSYKFFLSKKTLNLKLFYNLEKLRVSNLIEDLEKEYDFPVIVLFGSYVKAIDNTNSDIDICLISEIKKEINLEKYEETLNRKMSLHRFSKKTWKNAILNNKELVNSICNGIVLGGGLEVV